MDAQAIIATIMDGEADDSFDAIVTAINMRRRQIREAATLVNKIVLTPGTRVVLKGLRPKYLVGLHGEVLARDAKRPRDLPVRLDAGQYTGRYSRVINVPASCLEREA